MDRVANEEVHRKTRQCSVADEIGRRWWLWFGHTRRMSDVLWKALDWNPQGKHLSGRPCGTWRRVMNEDIERNEKA